MLELLRQLTEVKFESLDHPFDRRMVLKLQAYFVDDDWETELKEEPELLYPKDMHPMPDLSNYLVYPTVLEAFKGAYKIRAYFIRSFTVRASSHTNRIRICSFGDKTRGKRGYRDAKIVAGDDADDAWRKFTIAFKQKGSA